MPVRTWVDEEVRWIEWDRPERLNALDCETIRAARAALEGTGRVIVLAGAGERAFAAGADVAEMAGLDDAAIRSMMQLGKDFAAALEEDPRPTVAAVHGFALGGGLEMALGCDLIVASDTAQLGLPEIDLALIPGWGGALRVLRRVGYGRARDLLFTGRRIPAATALEWGLCDRVVPAANVRREVQALAGSIAAKDPGALTEAKRALQRAARRNSEEALAEETHAFVRLFQAAPCRAAVQAFVERSANRS